MIYTQTNFLEIASKQKPDKLKYIFILWVIFSSVYWIAAYNKPFYADEFYSWVYAERCTFKEIILLKERLFAIYEYHKISQRLF